MKQLRKFFKSNFYNLFRKKFTDIVMYFIQHENDNNIKIDCNSITDNIKVIYSQINDNSHIQQMFAKNANHNKQLIIDLFNKICLDEQVFFNRIIKGKHNRTYLLKTCMHKNAKTIFQLSIN